MSKKNIYKPMKGDVARMPTDTEKLRLAQEFQRPHEGFGADVTEAVQSCGNVFADLGFADAEERLAESDARIKDKANPLEEGVPV